jgi:tRNA(Ile)-lysidine synthase
MSMPIDILESLQQIAPVGRDDRFIVAISGGVDSVVLACLCKEAGLAVTLAHCNFQLRGAESDRDEAMVRQLATGWQLPLLVNRVDLAAFAALHKLSIQEAARQFRYQWFEALAVDIAPPCWILTAHQADDNAETVAMHFFRGTGLSGLTGIPPRNGKVLRPMLGVWRHQILQLAHDKNLSYVEDSSNTNEKYTRNYFRHTIIPAIEKVYPQVKENLTDSIRRFTEIETLYAQCMTRLRNSLLIKKGTEYKVSVHALRQGNGRTLLFELFTPFGFSSGQLVEIEKLLVAQNGALVQAAEGTYRLIRNRDFLLLSPAPIGSVEGQSIDSIPANVSFAMGRVEISELAQSGQKPPSVDNEAWLDASGIRFPMLLRPWKAGDYFYPLGMRKKKKIARFLIDQKLSATQKEKVWVLESDKKILWVLGMRIDDRFKVTNKTSQICAIHFIAGT